MLSAAEDPASSQETETAPSEQNEAVESAKKPRHWDAWTHDEEEKFFLALRQVGKNFDKVTKQVESKNKNQVRHYYYRLIKRMNRLLNSSELSLDAKNSRDVNVAMLCWWNLLGKFKCTSTKLHHLKPKRLKAFRTALEQQIIKDRKKAKKKLSKIDGESLQELASTLSPPASSSRKRSSTRSQPAAKKAAAGSVSKDVVGTSESPFAEVPDLTSNQGVSSTLQPTSNGSEVEIIDLERLNKEHTPEKKIEQRQLKIHSEMESKIKLQLFPIDDSTKAALEKDGHNPHLELTLKGTKSVSSVVQHLLQKWGRSSLATGELRLYPFSQGTTSTSWSSKDVGICAADVYAAVGKPAVFRLRYGWSQTEVQVCSNSKPPNAIVHGKGVAGEQSVFLRTGILRDSCDLREAASGCSWLYDKSADAFGQRLWRDEDRGNEQGPSPMEWVDSVGISVSQLLNEAPKHCAEPSRFTSSIWGGEETCDAFAFRKREQQMQGTTSRREQQTQEATLRKEHQIQEITLRREQQIQQTTLCREQQMEEVLVAPLSSRETEFDGSLLGISQGNSRDGLRSAALDLYWADSLGAMDGPFANVHGQNLLLNGNSSLGSGISLSLFPDSLEGFPRQPS